MKRLTYIPGMWSLGLLLPLCVWHLYRQDVWKQERCITMTFPIPADQRDEYDDWLRLAPKELRQEWIDLTCDGRQAEIDATLLSFRDSLRELESREDTIRGIHVHFGPGTKYSNIIRAVNICRTTVIFWALEDHDLWTGHGYEPKPVIPTGYEYLLRPEYRSAVMGAYSNDAPSATRDEMDATKKPSWATLIMPYWMTWTFLLLLGMLAGRCAISAVKLV